MGSGFPEGELSATDLVETLTSRGWRMVAFRLGELQREAMQRFRNGGKENHDRNAGYLQAVEDIIAKRDGWLEEAQALLKQITKEP